jgi:hypothetical protein
VPVDRYYVHINMSFDGGLTWQDLGDVTGAFNAQEAHLFIGDGKLHMVYCDMGTEDSWGGHYPIKYRWTLLEAEPIPEFSSLALLFGVLSVMAVPMRVRKLHRER